MNFWRIMPTTPQPAQVFDSAWAFDLANNTIAVSWWEIGDVRMLNELQFDEVCAQKYGNTSANTRRYIRSALLRFHGVTDDGVQLGDTIIACRGKSAVVGIGKVIGPSYYDEAQGLKRIGVWKDRRACHFLPVEWEMKQEIPVPSSFILPRSTFSKLSRARFETLYQWTKQASA